MKSKIKIFESTIEDGIMTRNKIFYSPKLNQKEIDKIFLETRLKLGKKYDFDGRKIFQAVQKDPNNNIEYPNGKYVILSEENMQKEDYWYEQIPADILMISEKYPNVVIGNQMSDCPILIAEDRKLGVTALSHCGVLYIDRELPRQTIQALKNSYQSNSNNIYVYIGSSAKKESYIYETYPTWVQNRKVWQGNIEKKNDKFHIDLIGAIKKQLQEEGITNIIINPTDTISNKKYYSHYAAVHGKKNKNGQNFVGCYYMDKKRRSKDKKEI